jgi:ribonuclease P protein component
LFASRSGIHQFPLKVLYKVCDDADQPMQAGVTVSSRQFKKAVDRNRIKRLVREAYRLQKGELLEHLVLSGKKMILFFIYTGKELPALEDMQMKMIGLLQHVMVALQKTNSKS